MSPALTRIALIGLFFLALGTTFTAWAQVGGQGHLDLMPWYWKLLPAVALAWFAVRAASAAAEQESAYNAKSMTWAICALTTVGVMAALTYYYHLTESVDEQDQEEPPAVTRLFDSSRPARHVP